MANALVNSVEAVASLPAVPMLVAGLFGKQMASLVADRN